MDSIKRSDRYEFPAGSKGHRTAKREKVLEEITAESCVSFNFMKARNNRSKNLNKISQARL